MSIENSLASIAKSLEAIANTMTADKQPAPAVHATQPAAPAALMPQTPDVGGVPAALAAPAVPAFAMPLPAPAPAPTGPAAPFTDGKGLMEYVMGKYRHLGPVKGGMIQNVLSEIGCKNINEVQPAQYGAFYAKVEAIQ